MTTSGPPPPVRPDAEYLWGRPTISDRPLRPWQRVLAVWGVISAFLYFFTIPGWYALDRYRRWKRGEAPRPMGLVVWGAVSPFLLAATIALFASGVFGSTQPTAPLYLGPWKAYTAADGTFSIRYPGDMREFPCTGAAPGERSLLFTDSLIQTACTSENHFRRHLLRILVLPSSRSLSEFFADFRRRLEANPDYSLTSAHNSTLDGRPAELVIATEKSPAGNTVDSFTALTKLGHDVVLIEFQTLPPYVDEERDIGMRVLRSFRRTP